jgi:hypothetical protein
MKRAVFTVLLALLTAIAGWGQNSIIDQLTFKAPAVNPVAKVTALPTAPLGNVTLYYWVIARYEAGVSLHQGPGIARGTYGVANLAKFPVAISWPAQAGATGYDVIRLTVPNWPATNTCVNCVVSSDQAGVTFTDNGGGVVNWPTAGTVYSRTALLRTIVNNRDADYPYLAVDGELHFMPTRRPTGSAGYAYLFGIGGQMTGTTAEKTYALGITVERPATSIATGDSNDAIIRGTYSNYAKNDGNFIMRGVNITTSNRSPGTLGMVEGGLISAANRSGGTAPIVSGLFIGVENFGVTANQFSGTTVSLKNEGAKATLEYGVKVQNDNNSLATAVDAAYMVRSSAGLANAGFQYGLDLNGSTIGTAEVRTSAGNNIYAGNGAPAAGLCAAPTLGSIYLRTAGGAGTSLYVCEVAGAWAGK